MKLKIFKDEAVEVEEQYNTWCIDKVIYEVQMRIKDTSPTLIIIAVWYTESGVIVPHVCSSCGCVDDAGHQDDGPIWYRCPVKR